MAKSLLERVCAARAAPIKTKCPIKTRAKKGGVLHDVPDTFIRNVIVLMDRQYRIAGRIMEKKIPRKGKVKNQSAWFVAIQEAHALEVLVFEYLRRVRRENSSYHYVPYRNWKYSVTRMR